MVLRERSIDELVIRRERRGRRGPNVVLFATGLQNPSHMEWTPDGRLLVCEHTAGQLQDVTKGGDFQSTKPFAYGLRGPSGIVCADDRVLVAESWAGRVTDITHGGDGRRASVFASDLRLPYGLAGQEERGKLRIFVGEKPSPTLAQLTEISDGGDRETVVPFVTNIPSKPGLPGQTPADSWPDRYEFYATQQCSRWSIAFAPRGSHDFLYITGVEGSIIGIPEGGGDFGSLVAEGRAVAWGLEETTSMKEHPFDGCIYVVRARHGDVIPVDPTRPGNYWFEPPVLRGINAPMCVRFSPDGDTMFVCSNGDGVVWKVTEFA